MWNRVIKTLTILSVLSLSLTLYSCNKGTDDPDPTDPPAFSVTGSLVVDGTTIDLNDWIQGPTSYSAAGQGFSGNIAKEGIGSFSYFVTNIAESDLKKTHDLSAGTDNGGLLNISLNGSPFAGSLTTGTLQITKNDPFQNTGTGVEFHLVSGSFQLEGVTTSGASFTINGSFENAQTIFN